MTTPTPEELLSAVPADIAWRQWVGDAILLLRELAAAREQIAKLEAERDSLKRRWFNDDDPRETEYAAEFAAYRDHPKEGV